MFDAIMPAAMAARAGQVGVKKATTDPLMVLALAVLGGAFISFGAIFATTVSAGGSALPYGVVRLLSGLVFSVGLILVVVAGAELFTGNNLIVMAWAGGKVKTRALALNWALVFVGNFVGAFFTAVLMFYSTQYEFGGGSVGLAALSTADGKLHHGFAATVVLGIMRARIAAKLAWLGCELDPGANKASATLISARNSRVPIYVVPTDEELMIAKHTLSVLSQATGKARTGRTAAA